MLPPELAVKVKLLPAVVAALPEVKVMVPAAVSVTEVMPEEVAAKVVALVEEMLIPPAPADAVKEGVVSAAVEETAPLLAVKVKEAVAVCAPVKAMLLKVEFKVILGATMLVNAESVKPAPELTVTEEVPVTEAPMATD